MNAQRIHGKYMQRCLELAAKGLGHVAPNPLVGAVLVYNDTIIGEGYHRKYGDRHAEPEAIASVTDVSLLKKSTLYVNLEPCSHYGKTPPCAQLIVEKNIPHVVIGGMDPFPEVAGRGIRMLQDAGVAVETGMLEDACEQLNRRFLTFYRRKRPYILLKWAQSADGFLDYLREPGDGNEAIRFSSGLNRIMLHKKRSEEAAIMVGTRTALLDNPSLTVRNWYGKNPLRIVIDRELTLPADSHLFSQPSETWIFTSVKKENTPGIRFYNLNFKKDILPQVMQVLYDEKIQSVIVEGGSVLLKSFLSSGLWDEITAETLPVQLKNGVKAPSLSRIPDTIYKCEKSIISTYSNGNLPKIL